MIVALTQFLYYFSSHTLFTYLLRARVDVSAVDLGSLRGPLILAANHPSRIDPFLIVLLPFRIVRRIVPFHVLTAAIYYDRWWIGPFARLMGAYRLAPSGRTVEDYLGGSLEHIRRGRSILFFPEGQLNREQQEWPAKAGVGQLALRTGAPILPLRINRASRIRLRDCRASMHAARDDRRIPDRSPAAGTDARKGRPTGAASNGDHPLALVHHTSRPVSQRERCSLRSEHPSATRGTDEFSGGLR